MVSGMCGVPEVETERQYSRWLGHKTERSHPDNTQGSKICGTGNNVVDIQQ